MVSDAVGHPTSATFASDEEEEPRLKYQRLGGSLSEILPHHAASCLAVSDKLLVLGTHSGTVHLLDVKGYEVKQLHQHSVGVTDVCCDRKGEFVASCASDGSVAVQSLYLEEKLLFEYNSPLDSIAIDPDYASNASRRFVVGGESGKLWMNNRGWLGQRDTVLHQGEGPVQNIKWSGNFIAWANNVGIKVFDCGANQRVGFIDLPSNSLHPELHRPQIAWNTPRTLIIAWPHFVKVATLRVANERLGLSGGGVLRPPGPNVILEVVASFGTDFFISGIAPFDENFLLLAYNQSEDGKGSERPEIRIVTSLNWEVSSDALPIRGYEQNKASDYHLAFWQPCTPNLVDEEAVSGGEKDLASKGVYGVHTDQEPLFFIVSPRDIVQARRTDVEDTIAWLISHARFAEALKMAENADERIQRSTIDSTWDLYLHSLLCDASYSEAAKMCSRLLSDNAAAWERCVFEFAQLRQLPVLVPFIPTEHPRLRAGVYEMVLKSLITTPEQHETLLSCIKSWPKAAYQQAVILDIVEEEVAAGEHVTPELQEALAELYAILGMKEKTFYIYIKLKKTKIFDFVEQNGLYSLAAGNVGPIFRVDPHKAMKWLVEHASELSPSEVVPQLSDSNATVDAQRTLLQYLHKLHQTGLSAAAEFADLQVRLYAEFDRENLMSFLVSSHHYRLDVALRTCEQFCCVKEHVYILNRMGNPKEALSLILNHIEGEMTIEDALDFVKEQRDKTLWEHLLEHSLQTPTLIGQLLDRIGGVDGADPLQLLERIPPGMHIPHLRDRVIRIIADYRTQLTLCSGASQILKRDCMALSARYQTQAKAGIHLGSRYFEERTFTFLHGSNKCSICFGPLCSKNSVVFFCAHNFHSECLAGFAVSSQGKELERACIVCKSAVGKSRQGK